MERRFSYNPITKEFLECGQCHSTALYNKGRQKEFDQFIRGIIKDKVLYLRLFYPLKDIDEKTIEYINEKSFSLLFDNKKDIVKKIKEVYKVNIKRIEYNAINDLLKEVLTNI